MPANLIRTTVYFEEPVLKTAKINAIGKNQPLYKVINQELKKAFGLTDRNFEEKAVLTQKPFKFEDVFVVKDMGLGKRKVKRSWAYE